MNYFLFFLLGISSFVFAQNQNSFPDKNKDFTSRLHNKDTFYAGEASTENIFKIKFDTIKKDLQKPERYLIVGVTDFEGVIKNFEGEIILKEKFGVRNGPDNVLLFGDFNFKENGDQENPGIFRGKIRIQTDKEITTSHDGASVTFKGELKSGDNEILQIWFSNFTHNDIDKVIFR